MAALLGRVVASCVVTAAAGVRAVAAVGAVACVGGAGAWRAAVCPHRLQATPAHV